MDKLNHSRKILIVDDSPENIHFLMGILQDSYKIIASTNGRKAIELAQKQPSPDLILLDVLMPDFSGYDVCRELKANQNTKDIPIIFITALGEIEDETNGLEMGAVDYIIKPINPSIVQARVKNHLTLQSLYRELQKANSVLEDKVKERTAQLEKMIMVDSLTNLPSRTAVVKQIEIAINQSQSNDNSCFALVQLDFNRFSLINSSLGHEIGDHLLQVIANRLQKLCHKNDLLARIGADNFCFLLTQINSKDKVIDFVDQILTSFKTSFWIDNYEIFVSCSLGIVFSNPDYQTPLEILRDVDTALHKAKNKGQNQYYIFEQNIREIAQKRLQLEIDLRRGIKEEQFLVFYQPIVDLKTLEINGFEALARWQHPTRGMVSPFEFIPCLEETGLITPVGLWIFEQSCLQQIEWEKELNKSLSISINLSPTQFSHPTLLTDIEQIIQRTKVNPKNIKLEITESVFLENIEQGIKIINELKSKNFSISLDDFGTGYSSLSYLQKLPIDYLKIDRSFVKDIETNQNSADLVQTIIILAQKFKMKVIAEGCETKEELLLLRSWNCEYSQGYFFSKPVGKEEATQLIMNNHYDFFDYTMIDYD
jgi:diguanylate cyclase (GGDEF)-like protein